MLPRINPNSCYNPEFQLERSLHFCCVSSLPSQAENKSNLTTPDLPTAIYKTYSWLGAIPFYTAWPPPLSNGDRMPSQLLLLTIAETVVWNLVISQAWSQGRRCRLHCTRLADTLLQTVGGVLIQLIHPRYTRHSVTLQVGQNTGPASRSARRSYPHFSPSDLAMLFLLSDGIPGGQRDCQHATDRDGDRNAYRDKK